MSRSPAEAKAAVQIHSPFRAHLVLNKNSHDSYTFESQSLLMLLNFHPSVLSLLPPSKLTGPQNTLSSKCFIPVRELSDWSPGEIV